MGRFESNVAIITGSSMGIGRALAFELGRAGAKIVINGRNKERLERTKNELEAAGIDVLAVPADVTNMVHCHELIDRTIASFGRIDFLINNVGISSRGTFRELDPFVFKQVMEINYLGAVYPTKVALPHLISTRGGVMFVSSVAGIRGIQGISAYSAAKMSLTALAESLRIELAGTGVNVGITYVGFTQNDPEKTILNSTGQLIQLQERKSWTAAPAEEVARKIVRNIRKRRFKSILTFLGKLNFVAKILFPRLSEWILIRANQRVEKMSN